MYEEFFGLRARPFGITPSADLFFHSSGHRRALACLHGHVLAGEPLIVLTGDIGAGKTTVLQVLLRNLSDKFAPAVVVSTQLDGVELTRSALIAFGGDATDEALDDLRTALRSRLEDLRSHAQRGLLVVDEAQNFSAETLRYLMQLPELAGGDEEPSLQVIISGHPGLRARAHLVEAGARAGHELPLCRLGPMSTMDTGSYVRHRLRVVGSTGSTDGPIFSDDAIDRIRLATGGVPRLVNRLCERILTSAYLDQTRDIGAARIARAAAELRAELGDSEVSLPTLDDHQPVPGDRPVSLPMPRVPTPAGPGVEPAPPPAVVLPPPLPARHVDSATAMPSPHEPAKRPDSRAKHPQRPYWAAIVAGGLLAVFFGWLAYDRSSPRNTTGAGVPPPANVVVPAGGTDAAGSGPPPDMNALAAGNLARAPRSDGQSAEGTGASAVRQPIGRPSLPMDARAALGLAPPPEPATAAPATAQPAAAPPATLPPTTLPPATAPPATPPPAVAPPANAPACSAAAKALGFCP